ncbi:MAG TPA: right-handed parallel beta-helix repeat-containing protein [Bryobacteraceae bacterium]|nr:right-handed parallel beta-helix repeat-containing protein [Bryobacteraceae bacterium]
MRLALIAALLLTVVCPVLPATFTVNSTADVVDAHPGDGVCETGSGNGICTLRAAVQEAGALSTANEIVIPSGTYTLTLTPACSYKLVTNGNILTENMVNLCVKGNVTISGAGADTTIIDANGENGATCCGSYPMSRGMLISQHSVVTLSGVTIENGISNGGYTSFGGGAINNQGTLNVSYCLFTNNNGIPGGTIWNDGTLVVDNVSFIGNQAGGYGGGGIYNDFYGTAEISNSTFDANEANAGSAIVNEGPSLKVLSSTMSNGTTTSNGGAITNYQGSVSLTNVTIVGNQAPNGGAIWNSDKITINNSTITLNRATNHTGGVSSTNTTVANSIISGNYDTWNNAQDDCEGPITSQGHNLISAIIGTCVVKGAISTDIYGVPAGLATLASNGGSTQTVALETTSPAIDKGDPSTPGSGGTACAAADQRGFLRPQNGRCDIGAFERISALLITNVSPTHAGNAGPVESVISGGGFAAGATVKLQKAGQPDILATQSTVQDGNASVGAVFDLTGKAIGSWDVVATNLDGTSSTLPGGFKIDAGGSPNVWAEVGGPALVRPGTSPFYYVLYGNRGNVDALDVPVMLAVPSTIALAVNFGVTPPPAQAGQVPTNWSQEPVYVTPGPSSGFVNVPLLLPIIPAGYTGMLRFAITIPTGLQHGEQFALYGATGDPLLQIGADPSALVSQLATGAVAYAQENLGVTVSASNAALNQYIANQLQNALAAARGQFSATSGSTPLVYSLGQLNIDAAQFAATQASGGAAPHLRAALARPLEPHAGSSPSTTQLCTTSDGKIVSIKVGDVQPAGSSCKDPEIFVPPPPCASGQESTAKNPCLPPDPGPPLTPSQCREIPGHHVNAAGTMCLPKPGTGCPVGISANPVQGADPLCAPVPIRSAIDPNAKSGPFGPGAQQFHTSSTTYNYNVEFENEATASLPAQQVVVTDTLDSSNLDLSTFSLGPIGFGSYTLTPPSGAQQFTGGVDLRPDVNLIVKVDAGLNVSTGVVTWHFTSLDPDTEQITTDPAAGFLPPNVTPPQGQGRMLYSIHPKAGIASGTMVCNQASVVFDTNAPINTQNWCNTVDDTAPSSSVTKLPVSESNATFPVQWSGIDTGSGVNTYTIYVSDNGTAWTAWLSNTTLTTSNYAGTVGHTYAFYSIATDMVGNMEGPKNTADTSTIVGSGGPPCATDVTKQFNIVRGGYRYNNATKRFQQVITITRTATGSLAGPFAFVLQALDADATLYNPAGTTSCIVPGSSYMILNPGASWASEQALSVTLDFIDPNKTGITYTPLMLNGATR